MIVLDTNVVSELLRRDPNVSVVEWLDRQPADDCYLTAITAAELWYGVARLPDGRRREALADGIAVIMEEDFARRVLPFDVPAARAYSLLVSERERQGRPISGFDAQIVSICWVYGAQLATRNVRDFEGVGIEVINPWG